MRKFTVLFFILVSLSSFAQEVISDLVSNPVLADYKYKINPFKSTLSLPFIDDFSYDSHQVDNDLWMESSVFVNRTYPINPPTIGVATFDGLDANGFARDFSPSTSSEPSDTLLSQTIDLSGISSAYFMFYYQAKGMGDAPQQLDKLVLEFFDGSVWNEIWSVNGQTMTEFEKIVEVIDSAVYLTNNFQFRFRNYATISGNFDHWHIDYIKIDEFVNPNDINELNDVSFVYNSPSFLKRYTQMPWTHFQQNMLIELKDSIDILLRNNDASNSVDYQYNVFENLNLITHYPSSGVSRNVSVLDFDTIGNFSFQNPPIDISSAIFSSFQPDTISFLVQNIIGTSSSDNKNNDTLYHTQKFHHHFAYDDGVAESAYGLNINGAKIAYQFKLNRPDEKLRAVQIYFPQMLDTVSDIPFELIIWNHNNGQPGDTLYTQTVYPVHTENGEFHTYIIDNPFLVSGVIYIGWEQTTDDLLNIGLDKNNTANDYMFYNIGSAWNNSSYPGAWMIRPVVSKNPIILSSEEIVDDFKLYPNPAKSELFIETNKPENVISIYNIQGVLIKRIKSNTTLNRFNIDNLASAIYIVEVENSENRSYQKIIVK
jgi:hypothetical protein